MIIESLLDLINPDIPDNPIPADLPDTSFPTNGSNPSFEGFYDPTCSRPPPGVPPAQSTVDKIIDKVKEFLSGGSDNGSISVNANGEMIYTPYDGAGPGVSLGPVADQSVAE
jgi:hypothetical protein